MRSHVSALTGPSSGLLKNQVCKCCLHAGIPAMFTIGFCRIYEGWNFNSGNYLFTTDTK